LRALAESADQFLERFGLWFGLARCVTRAQDCHGGGFEIGSNVPLKEIGEGDKGEAILSRRRVVALIYMWSMEVVGNPQREGRRKGGMRIQNGLPDQIWRRETGREGFRIRPLSSVGAKGAESGIKLRQIRRPFHPDVQKPIK
jgi:hypothetical protein